MQGREVFCKRKILGVYNMKLGETCTDKATYVVGFLCCFFFASSSSNSFWSSAKFGTVLLTFGSCGGFSAIVNISACVLNCYYFSTNVHILV